MNAGWFWGLKIPRIAQTYHYEASHQEHDEKQRV